MVCDLHIDILIPVYNEGENIVRTLEGIQAEVKCGKTIHLLYDFDQDSTLGPAREVARRLGINLVFIKNIYGRGVLNALKTGIKETSRDLVVVTMADLSDPPRVINDMVEKAVKESLDVVCGSRYMKGGEQIGGPWLKKCLSRTAGVSLNWLLRIPTHDVTNNFKLYRRRVLDSIEIESSGGFELAMELVLKAHYAGFKVGEVPTTWTDRTSGESRFLFSKWLPKYLKWYFYAYRKKLSFST